MTMEVLLPKSGPNKTTTWDMKHVLDIQSFEGNQDWWTAVAQEGSFIDRNSSQIKQVEIRQQPYGPARRLF